MTRYSSLMTTSRLWWSINAAGPAHQCQGGRGGISGVTLVSQQCWTASEIQSRRQVESHFPPDFHTSISSPVMDTQKRGNEQEVLSTLQWALTWLLLVVVPPVYHLSNLGKILEVWDCEMKREANVTRAKSCSTWLGKGIDTLICPVSIWFCWFWVISISIWFNSVVVYFSFEVHFAYVLFA